MNAQDIINISTFSLAILGSILGVINTVYGIQKDKVKIRVSPTFVRPFNAPHLKDIYIGFEITNLSSFPISISEVGFKQRQEKGRLGIFMPLQGGAQCTMPVKLEPRTQTTLWADYDGVLEKGKKLKYAYAKTACGLTFRVKNKVIKNINKKI